MPGMDQKFLDSWQRKLSGGSAGFDGFVRPAEVVPGERIDIRSNDQVGVALPGVELMLLRGTDGASNHLE